jgi:hypothetical protein
MSTHTERRVNQHRRTVTEGGREEFEDAID